MKVRRIVVIVAALFALCGVVSISAGHTSVASAAASSCHYQRTGQTGWDGQYLQISAWCDYGIRFQDYYQAWAQCWDGYGGSKMVYGATRVVGSGLKSTTLSCYGGAYGAQLAYGGVVHT